MEVSYSLARLLSFGNWNCTEHLISTPRKMLQLSNTHQGLLPHIPQRGLHFRLFWILVSWWKVIFPLPTLYFVCLVFWNFNPFIISFSLHYSTNPNIFSIETDILIPTWKSYCFTTVLHRLMQQTWSKKKRVTAGQACIYLTCHAKSYAINLYGFSVRK